MAFDREKWDNLMDILRKVVDWKERTLIQRPYFQQKVILKLGDDCDWKRGQEIYPTLFNTYLKEMIGKCLDGRRAEKMGENKDRMY